MNETTPVTTSAVINTGSATAKISTTAAAATTNTTATTVATITPSTTAASTTTASNTSSTTKSMTPTTATSITTTSAGFGATTVSTSGSQISSVVPSPSPRSPTSQSSSIDSRSVSNSTVTQVTTMTTSTTTTPVVQPTTSPPKTKAISIKVTFDITFKVEYRNKESNAYKELTTNFTKVLNATFSKMEGFIRVVVLSLREGSVVCDFDVIFKETAIPKVEDVKATLVKARKNNQLGGYGVKKIEVEGEKKDETTKDDLPLWATVTLILLGALGLVLLITVIILAVLLKRNKESGPLYQVSGEEWSHYESMCMGDYKVRAGEVGHGRLRNGDNKQPVYENHPTSHSNLTYQVPANGE
ncbi:cell wall protein DAN4-like [Actinia tenebrosa]|uniref:Cell wall protein DAN4-like n=1 Tax=Actinia tenebrosa TaxID=6105 RepID=A0A6P8IZA2_ACTTE|nr:cell wall protein DAN4-like [Actinia tenebrosa]